MEQQEVHSTEMNIRVHTISPTFRSIELCKDIVIIWFDQYVNESVDCLEFQAVLKKMVNRTMFYENLTKCEEYIQSMNSSNEDITIFLIVSGSDGEKLVSLVDDCNKLSNIYVFCSCNEKHRQWTLKYSKIRGIFVQKDTLLEKLSYDIHLWLHSLLPMQALGPKSLQKSNRDLTNEEASFMWFQLLLHIIRYMSYSKDDINQLAQFARSQYTNDDGELKKIRSFEINYCSTNALSWYTQDSFLYRSLNKALRTENFDVIYQFRSFISDIQKQITSLHKVFVEKLFGENEESTVSFYRGQRLTIEEFKKLEENVNGLIAMNTFMSTTTASEVALLYAGNGEERPLLESVFIEIVVDKQHLGETFADINNVSFFKNENEVLFNIGAVFRIESVYPLTPTISCVELRMNKESSASMRKLRDHFIQNISDHPNVSDICHLLLRMGQYERAKRYCLSFLENISSPENQEIAIRLYNTLSIIVLEGEGNHSVAELFSKKALDMIPSLDRYDETLVGQIWNNIGLINLEKGAYEIALEAFEKSMRYHMDSSTGFINTSIYVNMGSAHRHLRAFAQAVSVYEEALQRMSNAPELHPDIAILHNNLGFAYQRRHKYINGINHYNSALEIQMKSLPEDHSELATTLNNIGTLFSLQHKFKKAELHFQKAMRILENVFSCDHPRLASVYSNIADVYIQIGNYKEARLFAEKALNIQLKTKKQHSQLAVTLCTLGTALNKMADSEAALATCQRALELETLIELDDRTKIYCAISIIYRDQGDSSTAIFMLNKAKESSLDPIFFHYYVGIIRFRENKIDDAIESFQKSLSLFSDKPFEDPHLLHKIFIQLANLERRRDQFQISLQYAHKALDIIHDIEDEDVELVTDIVIVYNLIADIELTIGDILLAVSYLDKAFELYPNINVNRQNILAEILCTAGNIFLEENEIDLALMYLKYALYEFESILPTDEDCISIVHGLIATAYEMKFDYQNALVSLQTARDLYKIVYSPTHNMYAVILHRITKILQNQDLFIQALRVGEEASNIVEQNEPKDYHILACIYDTLSSINMNIMNYDEALLYSEKALELRTTYHLKDLSVSHLGLALAYAMLNLKDDARLHLQLSGIGVEESSSPAILFTFAKVYYEIDDMDRCQETATKALILNNFVDKRLQINLLTIIVKVHFSFGKYSEAEATVRTALCDYSNIVQNVKDVHLGNIYCILGGILLAMNKLDEALYCLNTGRGILSNYFPSDHSSFNISSINLATLYKLLGQYDLAITMYQQVLQRTISKEESVTIYTFLGDSYSKKGEMAQSLASFHEAETILTTINSFTRKYYRMKYELHWKVGNILAETGTPNWKNIVEHWEKALTAGLMYNTENIDVLETLYFDLGHTYYKMGHLDKAETYLLHANKLQSKRNSSDDHMVRTLMLLGMVFTQKIDYTTAQDYYNRALLLCDSVSDLDKLRLHIYMKMGHNYREDYNLWAAESMFEKALVIALESLLPSDEVTEICIENLNMIREEIVQINKKIMERTDFTKQED